MQEKGTLIERRVSSLIFRTCSSVLRASRLCPAQSGRFVGRFKGSVLTPAHAAALFITGPLKQGQMRRMKGHHQRHSVGHKQYRKSYLFPLATPHCNKNEIQAKMHFEPWGRQQKNPGDASKSLSSFDFRTIISRE